MNSAQVTVRVALGSSRMIGLAWQMVVTGDMSLNMVCTKPV